MRTFDIVSHTIEGNQKDTVTVLGVCSGAHKAVEGYNDTHGCNLYIIGVQ
jgi:hypothetical protein